MLLLSIGTGGMNQTLMAFRVGAMGRAHSSVFTKASFFSELPITFFSSNFDLPHGHSDWNGGNGKLLVQKE